MSQYQCNPAFLDTQLDTTLQNKNNNEIIFSLPPSEHLLDKRLGGIFIKPDANHCQWEHAATSGQ